MKNVSKLHIVLGVFTLCFIMSYGCKKDNEKASSPGYFTVDGKKYDLGKAFYDYAPENDYRGVSYIQHAVYFLSDGIVINQQNGLGKGAVAMFQCMDPLKVQLPSPGEYTYQGDYQGPKSFTYFDFSCSYSENWAKEIQDTAITRYYDINERVVVKENGGTYEFKSTGTTGNGKAFEFYYKGTILPMPTN